MPIAVEMTENDITEDYVNSEIRLSGRSKIVDWLPGYNPRPLQPD